MVRWAPSLYRSGTKIYFCLHRDAVILGILLQHDHGELEGVQVLLGLGEPEMERQIRLAGSTGDRTRCLVAVLLLSSRAGRGVSKAIIWRHAADLRPQPKANYRLAGPGKIRIVRGLPGHGAREESGTAGGRIG